MDKIIFYQDLFRVLYTTASKIPYQLGFGNDIYLTIIFPAFTFKTEKKINYTSINSLWLPHCPNCNVIISLGILSENHGFLRGCDGSRANFDNTIRTTRLLSFILEMKKKTKNFTN